MGAGLASAMGSWPSGVPGWGFKWLGGVCTWPFSGLGLGDSLPSGYQRRVAYWVASQAGWHTWVLCPRKLSDQAASVRVILWAGLASACMAVNYG